MAGISTNDKNNDHFCCCACVHYTYWCLILTTLDAQLHDFYMAHILLSQNYQFLHLVFFQSARSYGAVLLSHFCFRFSTERKIPNEEKEVVEISLDPNTSVVTIGCRYSRRLEHFWRFKEILCIESSFFSLRIQNSSMFCKKRFRNEFGLISNAIMRSEHIVRRSRILPTNFVI